MSLGSCVVTASKMSTLVSVAKRPLTDRAIVIGAGISGLSAARVLSEFCEEVIVLERDVLPPHATHRLGVPQGKHPHGLLFGAMMALEDLFPGFGHDLATQEPYLSIRVAMFFGRFLASNPSPDMSLGGKPMRCRVLCSSDACSNAWSNTRMSEYA